MRRLLLSAVGFAVLATPAGAHGPCDCLIPASGPPGTAVRAEYGAYKVVFNPDRADLGIGPEDLWEMHRGPAPVTVLRRPWKYGRRYAPARFAIPAGTPPGRYLVALYDGGEGGFHYTWERFTVTRAPSAGPANRAAPEKDVDWAAWIAGAAGLVLGSLTGVGLARRRS